MRHGCLLSVLPLLLTLFISGCGSEPMPNPFAGGADAIGQTSKDIRHNAERSLILTEAGGRAVPDRPEWNGIAAHQRSILELTDRLDAATKAQRESEKKYAQVLAELERVRSESAKWESWVWTLFVVFGAGGLVAAPVVAYFAAPRLAMLIAVAGVSSIAVGMTMRAVSGFFAQWGWLIGGGIAALALFGLGVTGWIIYRRAKDDESLADHMARVIAEVRDERTTTNIDDFIAAFADRIPALKQAWRRVLAMVSKHERRAQV